jgi:hypothetical protein
LRTFNKIDQYFNYGIYSGRILSSVVEPEQQGPEIFGRSRNNVSAPALDQKVEVNAFNFNYLPRGLRNKLKKTTVMFMANSTAVARAETYSLG